MSGGSSDGGAMDGRRRHSRGPAEPEERAEPVPGKVADSPARFGCQTTPGKAPGRGNLGTPLARPPAPPGPARGGQRPTNTWIPKGIPPPPTPAASSINHLFIYLFIFFSTPTPEKCRSSNLHRQPFSPALCQGQSPSPSSPCHVPSSVGRATVPTVPTSHQPSQGQNLPDTTSAADAQHSPPRRTTPKNPNQQQFCGAAKP